ncbi:polyprenyl diphosphate synthase [Sabulicella rubraurantiaca]|uniref:polyprenyl diphosphate synthase n=1 Tax=Sabulicella rubraurantiaca TaxID=2811429 RepID=UPI001A95BFA4|nr:polyprenyl diphosphate synthase [Sabulicella rubraurantiaca]
MLHRPAQPAGAGGVPPRHVAVIMDGNRRWAEQRGLPTAMGHRAGAEAVRRTIEAAITHGVPWLTLFAFSSENWSRPKEEVQELTGLLRHYLRAEVAQLDREGVRLRVIGERHRFGPDTLADIEAAEARTRGNVRLNLTVALSYGARSEIVAAARAAMRAGVAPEALDEASFARHLYTAGQPDPDLIIRTSGEQRLSNFLLWQAAYAELAFPPVLWPDFGAEHFAACLADFSARERRFGARAG